MSKLRAKIDKILRGHGIITISQDAKWDLIGKLEALFNSNLKEEREGIEEIVKLCAKEQSCSMCKEYLGRKK